MQENLGEFVARQLKDHYGKVVTTGTLVDWVEDLSGFKYFTVHQAFKAYRQSGKRYAPKPSEIVSLARELMSSGHAKKTQDGVQRCYISACENGADDRRGENVWMCSGHSEEWILKTQPDSLFAKVMAAARKLEEEARIAGISNREYFNSQYPGGYKMAKKALKQSLARG